MSNPENIGPKDHAHSDRYMLQLFVTGATPNSLRAVANIKLICEQYLKDNYELEIIDVYQEKEKARDQQLVALPMLIKRFPLPERKLIGDLSRTNKVLEALGL
jgi:circadian clock protein KaiB